MSVFSDIIADGIDTHPDGCVMGGRSARPSCRPGAAGTGVRCDLAGTAAGVFKMSSMVGGSLGVALLTRPGSRPRLRETGDAIRAAGLTDAEVQQARAARPPQVAGGAHSGVT
jgi:hypothetical protein